MRADMEFVSSNAKIPFRCQRCAECCRHVEDSLMLEPLDIYRLAKDLCEHGESYDDTSEMLNKYAHSTVIDAGFPIFQLNTVGEERACVFLKDGRCSVYEARPQVCRMYPFGVAPGTRGKDFNYYLCTEREHHFGAGMVKVKDWLSENFKREAREFYKTEHRMLPEFGRAVKGIGEDGVIRNMFQILYYLYFGYDLTEPFLPQYENRMSALLALLGGNAKESD